MFCPHCGKEMIEGQAFCPHCGGRVSQQEPEAEAGRKKTPWEDRQAQGFINGILMTLRDSMINPAEFFKKMPVTGGLMDPLLYAMITGMIGLIFSYAWQLPFEGMLRNYLPADIGSAHLDIFHGMGMAAGLAIMAVISPFMIIIWLFAWAGILHLCLMMMKGAKAGFEATFRAAAYSYGSNILLAIPFCGGLVALIWQIVLVIIGLREAHETTGGKAAFAVFFPLILCCGIVIMVIVLFMGAVAASLGIMTQQWK